VWSGLVSAALKTGAATGFFRIFRLYPMLNNGLTFFAALAIYPKSLSVFSVL